MQERERARATKSKPQLQLPSTHPPHTSTVLHPQGCFLILLLIHQLHHIHPLILAVQKTTRSTSQTTLLALPSIVLFLTLHFIYFTYSNNTNSKVLINLATSNRLKFKILLGQSSISCSKAVCLYPPTARTSLPDPTTILHFSGGQNLNLTLSFQKLGQF